MRSGWPRSLNMGSLLAENCFEIERWCRPDWSKNTEVSILVASIADLAGVAGVSGE